MGIIERIVDRFRKSRIQDTQVETFEYPTFTHAKSDFISEAFGASGFDLANAFSRQVVNTADLVRIFDKSGQRTVSYLEPELGAIGKSGYHRVLELRDDSSLPSITTQGDILHWEVIQSGSQEERARLSKFLTRK